MTFWQLDIRVSNIDEGVYDQLIADMEGVCKKYGAKFFPGVGEEDFDAEAAE